MTFQAVQPGGIPPGFMVGGPMINGIPAGGGQFPSSPQALLSGTEFGGSQFPTPGTLGAQPQLFPNAPVAPFGMAGIPGAGGGFPGAGGISSIAASLGPAPGTPSMLAGFGPPVGTERALMEAAQKQQQMMMMQQMAAAGGGMMNPAALMGGMGAGPAGMMGGISAGMFGPPVGSVPMGPSPMMMGAPGMSAAFSAGPSPQMAGGGNPLMAGVQPQMFGAPMGAPAFNAGPAGGAGGVAPSPYTAPGPQMYPPPPPPPPGGGGMDQMMPMFMQIMMMMMQMIMQMMGGNNQAARDVGPANNFVTKLNSDGTGADIAKLTPTQQNSALDSSLAQIQQDPEGAALLKEAERLGVKIEVGDPSTARGAQDKEMSCNCPQHTQAAADGTSVVNGVTLSDSAGNKRIVVRDPSNIKTIVHELVHAVSTGDGNSKEEEGIADVVGSRIANNVGGAGGFRGQSDQQIYQNKQRFYGDLNQTNGIRGTLARLGINVTV